MGNIIVVAILIVIIVFAARSGRKHLKGEGGCCGGGDETIAEPPKTLENPVIGKMIVHIEGMHCENCRNRVERIVNQIDGAACRADLKRKLAEIEYDRPIDERAIRSAIERLEYTVTGVEEG